ncbi:MAG: hypothetical protein ACRC1H_09820, partial [Caldilineaceae bacterium]
MSRLLLIAVLVIATLLPAAVFAQSEITPGVYVSDPVTGGDDAMEGAVIAVILLEDGTQETITEYPDGELVFEQGVWEDLGDGTVSLIFVISNGELYEEPIEVIAESDGESLTAAELVTYGPDGLTVFLTEDEPVSVAEDLDFEPTADAIAAAMGDMEVADDEEDADGLAGIYVSDVGPGDVGPALLVVYMGEEGELQVVFTGFDGATPPTTSIGTWEETEDGTVLATLEQDIVGAGEDAEAVDIEDPSTIELVIDGDVLVGEDFNLYPVEGA